MAPKVHVVNGKIFMLKIQNDIHLGKKYTPFMSKNLTSIDGNMTISLGWHTDPSSL